MMKCNVRTAEDALVYLTDCTLATVGNMAMFKSRKKYEYERQKSIAETAIKWLDELSIDYSGTRVNGVKAYGSVDAWAKSYETPPC